MECQDSPKDLPDKVDRADRVDNSDSRHQEVRHKFLYHRVLDLEEVLSYRLHRRIIQVYSQGSRYSIKGLTLCGDYGNIELM